MKHTLLVFLFFAGTIAMAQTKVSGTLVDKANNQPLEYGTVSLYNPGDSSLVTGSITDMNGKYVFKVAPGTYYLVAQFVSYQSVTKSDIVIPSGKTFNMGALELSADVETLEEVKITAQRQQVEMLQDRRVFNVAEDISNQGRSASEILDRIPSVAVDQEGNVSLRGSENVQILINGKPSGLIGLSDNDGLRLLQGNMVEKVELITNPSARYEAQGDAGIINIILKKERNQGFNGTVALNTGYPHDHGASFNLNYRTNNFNFFGNYGIGYRKRPGEGQERRMQFSDDTTSYLYRDFEFERGGLSNNFQVGAEYFFNDKTILTGSLLYRRSDENNDRDTYYRFLDENLDLQQRSVRFDNEKETENNLEYTLSFMKEFSSRDHEFSFDVQYRNNDEVEKSDLQEFLLFGDLLGEEEPLIQRSQNEEGERNIRIQSYYKNTFGEQGNWEVGILSNFRRIKNNYIVEEQAEDGEFFPLFNFSNDFAYDENIQAFYGIIGNRHNKISWQAGLRGEYTDIRTDLVPLDPSQEEEINNKEYFNLFPSGSITYHLKGENTVQASYSRRISRPGFWFLNPFSNFSDPRYLRTGNPDLDPVYTDSYELGYLLNWPSGSLYSSVYYRHSTGEWERITLVDDEGVSTSFPVNLSVENAWGFEFNYSQDLADWWTMNANGNLYYSVTDGEFSDVRYYAENLSFNGRINSRWKVWKKLDVQANYRYRAPQTTTQGSRKSFNVLDIGLSTDILKGNGTLVANVNDVFNTGLYRGITEGENFYSEGSYRRRFRQFTVNFTYRINQKKQRQRDRDGRGNGEGGDFEGEF